jgi:hypothetical protein
LLLLEALLPGYEVTEERQAAARHFYTTGELQPLADFIEKRLLPVFDNRDLPLVEQILAEAGEQLSRYSATVEQSYDPKLKLHTHALAGIGLARLVW